MVLVIVSKSKMIFCSPSVTCSFFVIRVGSLFLLHSIIDLYHWVVIFSGNMGSTGLLLIAHERGKLVFEGKLLDNAHILSLEPPTCYFKKKQLVKALSSLCYQLTTYIYISCTCSASV